MKTTESPSLYNDLEKMSVKEILENDFDATIFNLQEGHIV